MTPLQFPDFSLSHFSGKSAATKCGECQGLQVKEAREELTIVIDKGMVHNQKLRFPGAADQEVCRKNLFFFRLSPTHCPIIRQPGMQPGDVIIVLQEEKHDVFERQGQDLWVDKTISLVEALCGAQFPLTHLDGVRSCLLVVFLFFPFV
jgi:DnaJ family protein A protein 2